MAVIDFRRQKPFNESESDDSRPKARGLVGRLPARLRKAGIPLIIGVVGIACLALFSDGFKARVLARIAGSYSEQGDAYSFLKRHCDMSDDPSQSLETCKRFAAMRPTDAYSHALLGNAYAELGRTTDAIAAYRHAISLDPNCFDAHLGLGRAQFSLGNYLEAVESYGRALQIRPDSAALHLSLGLALSNAGQYEKAMQAFQRARELDPSVSDKQILTGKAYLEDGMCAQAIESLKGAVLADQEHAQAYFNLGRAYLRAGDKALAIEQQQILQRLDPRLADELGQLIEQ